MKKQLTYLSDEKQLIFIFGHFFKLKACLNISCLLQNVTYNCFSQTVEQTFLIETVYYISVYRFIILRPPLKVDFFMLFF